MLWGQKLEIYTDHKNLVRDTLDFTCDRVHRWRLILEEYDPRVFYVPGSQNVVADAVSRLEYDDEINTRNNNIHTRRICFITLLNRYADKTARGEYITILMMSWYQNIAFVKQCKQTMSLRYLGYLTYLAYNMGANHTVPVTPIVSLASENGTIPQYKMSTYNIKISMYLRT